MAQTVIDLATETTQAAMLEALEELGFDTSPIVSALANKATAALQTSVGATAHSDALAVIAAVQAIPAAPSTVTVQDGGDSITVDGTVTVANPGLTDTQLRATAVPVSVSNSPTVAVSNTARSITSLPSLPAGSNNIGTVLIGTGASTIGNINAVGQINSALPAGSNNIGNVTVANPGLTDTQLRATAVPVSGTVSLGAGSSGIGTVTVANPGLTDTQLRATALPVSSTALTSIDGKTPALVGGASPVAMPSVISTANSTTSILNSGVAFTGLSEDVSNYAAIQVSVFANVASAVDGLSIQQSHDGTNWDFIDTYTIPANNGKTYSFQPIARYFRIVYTNGGSNQAQFRLQTVFHVLSIKASSQRAQDAYTNETDLEQSQGFGMLYNPVTGLWDRARTPSYSTSGTITVINSVPAGAGTAGSFVEIAVNGNATLTTQVTGTYTGALSLQATIDGTNWITLTNVGTFFTVSGSSAATIASATQSIFQSQIAGYTRVRVTALAAVTGTATVTLSVATSPLLVGIEAPLPTGTNTIGAVTATLNAGTNNIGRLAQSIVRQGLDSVGLTIATTNYSAGDFVGARLDFTGANVSTWGGVVMSAQLLDKSNIINTCDYEVWLTSAALSAPTDNAAFAVTDADMSNVIAVIKFPVANWTITTNNSFNQLLNLQIPYTCSTTVLSAYMVTRTNHNFFSAVGDLRLTLGLARD